MTGIYSAGWSSRTEFSSHAIWCYLQEHSIRTEVNCRTPGWCQEIAYWCGKTPSSNTHTHTHTHTHTYWNGCAEPLYEGTYQDHQVSNLVEAEFQLRYVCILNHFSHVWLFATPWTVALQAPLSMGFTRKEYWSGLPCPPPEQLGYIWL